MHNLRVPNADELRSIQMGTRERRTARRIGMAMGRNTATQMQAA